MLVKELIERLREFPPDAPVIVASDAEGNSFSDMYDIDASMADKTTYGWDLVHPDDVDEYDQDLLVEAVVIWP